MGLAAACDIAVASTKAIFATSEVKFGIIPAAISPYVLRAIGARQAYRYFQSAERIDAARARDIGLVHETVEPEQLDAKVSEIVDSLLQGGPLASRCQGADPRGQWPTDQRRAGRRHCPPHCPPARHPEAREGIAAFLDKRQPNWIGE
jgi:methylglutaconyl-CoA hydratase